MPVVWSDRCRLHDPGGEIFVGNRTPGTEVVARADAILAALAEADARVVDAVQHSDVALVVPLGVDAGVGDPESPLCVTATGFRHAGAPTRRVGTADGARPRRRYDLESLGQLVREVLLGVEEGR